jgi:hypothetical protein
MVRLKEPNLLNFFEARRSKVPVPHFEFISIPHTYNIEDSLNKWIQQHLKGRYFIGKCVEISLKTDHIETVIKIGFEDGKELAYFMLACPLLKYK